MSNTPKTVESLINEAETKWASQGRTDEQKWAVRNFITGSMQEAITALNELRKADMAYVIGEDDIDFPENADNYWTYPKVRTRLRDEQRLRAEERLQK